MKTILSSLLMMVCIYTSQAQISEIEYIDLGLSAEIVNTEISLYWVKNDKTLVRYYEVEKLNKEKEWIGILLERPMAGQQTFSSTDKTLLTGLNTYRIKAKTREGKAIYSKPVELYFEPLSFDIMIYPNPANAWLVVNSDKKEVSFKATLVDSYGNKVLEAETTEGSCVLNTAEVIEGMYFLKVEGPGANYKKSVIINHR